MITRVHVQPYASRLRGEAYDDIVFSPHLDDAVYSMAGTVLSASEAGRRVLVVTVFGHGQRTAPEGTGLFDDYSAREREDRAAMLELDVDYVWLNLPELIFRRSRGRELLAEVVPHASFAGTKILSEVRAALARTVGRFAAEGATLHIPLAVGAHPDHRLVHEAARHLSASHHVRFYEDVPYALESALVESRLSVLGERPGPRAFSVARGLARLAFKGIGRAIALLPLVLYVAMAEAARRARARLRGAHASLFLSPVDHDIGAFVGRKVHAMRLYRSQTPLFFENEDALANELPRRDGIFVERSWRCAP